MDNTTPFISFVRINGTHEYRLTVGKETVTLQESQAILHAKSVNEAILGGKLNRAVLRESLERVVASKLGED